MRGVQHTHVCHWTHVEPTMVSHSIHSKEETTVAIRIQKNGRATKLWHIKIAGNMVKGKIISLSEISKIKS